MRSIRFLGVTLACLALVAAGSVRPALAQSPAVVDIPFEKFTLPNGLTVIVHEDHKAPIVAVNVWYHVGSKNEKPGRTGFAHLFEHLMFNGSENYDDDYFKVLDPIGATDLNGTTNEDRTNYFQNVPTSAVDVALWMESDRMGHLLGAITQAKLDEQRGVVQNEKRQGENQPYGKVWNEIAENTYPKGHPYSWSVIGSMEDLGAASLDDVKEWFQTYYGPSNAVLVIAGDIDVATARQKVEQYFGDIPPGPPITKHETWIAKSTGEHRQIMQDRVPQARIYMVWNMPEWKSRDAQMLDLVSDVLTSGKTSRLYKRLVYDEQIATDVGAFVDTREIGGQFVVMATARPDANLADVERGVREEMAKLLAEGPTNTELQRVKTQARASFIRGVERIGGFGGKSDVLAQGEVYAGDPEFHKTRQERIAAATAADLRDAAQRWLADGAFIIEVHPFPDYATGPAGVDRSTGVPEAGSPPAASFPAIQRATLPNGLEIVLAERHTIPVVRFELTVDGGYAADQFGTPGTASLAMDLMDEGTARRTSLQISEELALLGASLGSGAGLDAANVSLSALKENLDASLDVFADVVLHPAFPENEFARLKRERLARIQQEKAQPIGIALRVFSTLLYGQGHAYGNPLTGSGTEASVQGMTRDDLAQFHATWFKPNNAKLLVVGDITMEEIRPKLERLFRDWRRGDVPQKNLATVPQKDGSAIYVFDRPGAQQSMIIAGHVAPPRNSPDEIAIEAMNTILGGEFTARINMNLREDKHWSYGAQSLFWPAKGQRPFFVYAPVQSDKTAESVAEIRAELSAIGSDRPATAEELDRAKASRTLTLPGQWETAAAVLGSISEIVEYGLPDDYFATYPGKVRALTLSDINRAAGAVLHPDKVVWIVVGDRAKIEQGLRDLNIGPVREIDADGNLK